MTMSHFAEVKLRNVIPESPDRARIVPKTRAAAANERSEASATNQQRALTW